MCAYPTEDFQTCYLKHTFFFIWPYLKSHQLSSVSRALDWDQT